MLANTTGFSLKKDGSVSHCCGSCGSHCCDFPNQQTPRDFLMNNTFVSKIRPSQNAALWLSPPSVVLEKAHGQLSCFHGDLSTSYFPVLHFFDWAIWIMSCRSTCDWKKCKIIFSVEYICGPNFSVQNDLIFCRATHLALLEPTYMAQLCWFRLKLFKEFCLCLGVPAASKSLQHSVNKTAESL